MEIIAGQIIEFEGKESMPSLGIVLGFSGKGVRVLLLNRKETTITERSILHRTILSRANPTDLDECITAGENANKRRQKLTAELNLEDLHSLLVEEIKPYSLGEISSFLGNDSDEDYHAAILRKLRSDTLFFKNRKEGFIPVPTEEVQTMMMQQKRRKEQEEEDSKIISDLNSCLHNPPSPVSQRIADIIDSLIQVAVFADEAHVPKRILDILEKAGLKNDRKLFNLLVKIGRFSPDENLSLIKHRIPIEFPEPVVSQALEISSAEIIKDDRQDFRDLPTWAIDSEGTKDRDDAFSLLKESNGNFHLFVHIADPTQLIALDSPIDREACRRGTTLYLPDGNIPMIPSIISEDHLSLNQGQDRPCMTFKMNFSDCGELIEFSIIASMINVNEAIDYLTADKKIESVSELFQAVRLGKILKEKRRALGGILIERQPELKINLTGEGIEIVTRPMNSPCQDMIAEFMIWTNHFGAKWFHDNNIPCLFRAQEPPDRQLQHSENFDPVTFFSMLRSFKKTNVSTKPGLHGSIGLNPYCQLTSPLRRYSDFLLHRQMKAFLSNKPIPFDESGLSDAIMKAEEATRTGEDVMQDRYKYFLFKFLKAEQKAGCETSPGTIVEIGYSEVFVFVEKISEFCHCRKPSFDLVLGQPVTVRFKQIDPFDRILRIEIAN